MAKIINPSNSIEEIDDETEFRNKHPELFEFCQETLSPYFNMENWEFEEYFACEELEFGKKVIFHQIQWRDVGNENWESYQNKFGNIPLESLSLTLLCSRRQPNKYMERKEPYWNVDGLEFDMD